MTVLQPGGGGGKMRVRYTARRKRGLVATVKRMMAEEGKTLRAAASELRVSAANLLVAIPSLYNPANYGR